MKLITQGAAESTDFFAGSTVGCHYQQNLTLEKKITNSAACGRKIMIIPIMVIDRTVFGPIPLTLITHLPVRIGGGIMLIRFTENGLPVTIVSCD